jgi:hypothetical protein
MEEILLHEMAHAATSGEHDAKWLEEMERLKVWRRQYHRLSFVTRNDGPTSWNVFGRRDLWGAKPHRGESWQCVPAGCEPPTPAFSGLLTD